VKVSKALQKGLEIQNLSDSTSGKYSKARISLNAMKLQ
jgi:hypothetical protein